MKTKEGGIAKGGRPRSLQAQQALFDATLALLSTEGFDTMSVDTIAERAGVGKPTIYRWWPSKEALVIDAIKSLQLTHNPVLDTGSLSQDLLAMFTNASQAVSGPHAREFVVHLLAMMMKHPDVYQTFYDQAVAPRLRQLEQVIRRAQERGDVRRDLDAGTIIGLVAGPLWYHLVLERSKTTPLPEQLLDAILHGVAFPGKLEEAGTKPEREEREGKTQEKGNIIE